ncbi:long-chain fatty acid--CoA ligase [Spongiactinospora sp. TRM90649]|uniref:acyl-CoA synthetase n=1 Tax=Spongiactinospora sp. TRM90649 TaxID=3031114 RepID=UPI0023F7059D|nr:long-chain fatty acid--CoA ligase [Spongiactinospora sp. TRM90649]MDF5755116.1 long-chain fatty acid--CoA ligase [Spongiactinospora sp. TRM90649]
MLNQGLGSWPLRRARATPHRPAVVTATGELTFAGLAERTTRLAHALRSMGVRRGDRVAYLGSNAAPLVETMFAAHLLGAVFVPLNTRLTAAELSFQLDDCAASVLLHDAGFADVVSRLRVTAVTVGEGSGGLGYEERLRASPADTIDEPVGHADPAMILYTSGTTGRPKGAVLTHGNVIWNSLNVIIEIDITSTEVTLVSAPLFHVAALNMTLLPTLLKGGRVVLMNGWEVDTCFDLVERHRVTWMFGVPTMFADLTRSPRWNSADLSSIRSLLTGGASVPPALIAAYQERGLRFVQGYGLTEASPGALIVPADMSTVKIGAAGVPHFFSDVRLAGLDPAGTGGTEGELLINGPTVMAGYWGRPDATAAAITEDGWIRTGDVGRVDEDGYYSIVGRLKEMYISGGENVYPAEVEAALLLHPEVEECAVIGVPDERWGEVGRAFVRLRPGRTIPEQELLAFLDGGLARYKIPKSVRFVDELPRTGSGKLDRGLLR